MCERRCCTEPAAPTNQTTPAQSTGRWNEEVAAATAELQRTRKALAEVQGHLQTLVGAAPMHLLYLRACVLCVHSLLSRVQTV